MKTQLSLPSIMLLASTTAVLIGRWLGGDFTALVLFVVALACYLFLPSKAAKTDPRQKELEQLSQRVQRVEELLERIAAAVERK
jgi:hypothetical protein